MTQDLQLRRLKQLLDEKRREILRPGDLDRMDLICKRVELIWSRCRPPYPFPPHDHTHCLRVEEKLYDLISTDKMKDGLTSEENFLLLSSIWLHDVGMCPELFKDDKLECRNARDTEAWDKSVRKNHAERSARYIKERGRELDLTSEEIDSLMKMCLLHRHKAYQELYLLEWSSQNGTKLPLLIAYLRLADALHIPHKAEKKEFKIYLSLGMGPISRFHWFKSKYARNVNVYPERFMIEIILKRPQCIAPEQLEPLNEVIRQEIQDELDSIKDILSRGGLSLFLTVQSKSDVVQNMSKSDERQLKELLANIQLFDPTLTPSASSVIDNVLTQIKMLINSTEHEEVIRYLNDYRKNALADILKKRPCYVFLKKVEQLLEDTLNSELHKQAKIDSIRKKIDLWKARRQDAMSEIPKMVFGILADSSPVLLYGYSNTIVRCFEHYLLERKRNIEVFICEARTKTQYRYNNRLTYSDGIKYAEELKRAEKRCNDKLKQEGLQSKVNINVTLVPDSCASNLFLKKKISKILFGANGISSSGRIGHTLGHLAIADMASIYNVPVYVIADSMKIGYFQEDPELPRGNPWLTTDIKYEPIIKEFKNYNPREDIIPPERIEAIITEKGIIKPTEVMRHMEKEN